MEEGKKKAKKTTLKKEEKKVVKQIDIEIKKDSSDQKVVKKIVSDVKKKAGLKVPSVFYYGTGKRKTAIAKVWLFKGTGEVFVNNRKLIDYFCSSTLTFTVLDPLAKLGVGGNYDIKMSVLGGGLIGQADACRHGISRALLKSNEDFKSVLKENGFLTRDARIKERKKYGRKKARKGYQFRKR